MKKIVLPLLAAVLLSGCDILDKEPLTTIAPSTYYQTADDAEGGLTAAYDALQATGLYSQDLIVLGEMPSDNCTSESSDVISLQNITWNASTGQFYNLYLNSYQGINRANAVLKYVPGVAMDNTTRKTQILAEARFLRGLHYFNLVKAFGGVPIRLEPTESATPAVLNLPRATSDEVYAQAIADLTEAASAMPVDNPTRAGQSAAYALLSRVYLYQRQWNLAQAAANQVLTNSSYVLASRFKALFPANNNPESIFEVQNAGALDGNNILPDLLLPSPPATYSFPKFNIPTINRSSTLAQPTDLTFAIDTISDRRWSYQGNTTAGRDHASYVDGGQGTSNDDGPFVYKWPGAPNNFNSPDNTYVLRLGEVLLNYAEAANELNGPSADVLEKLNRIRQRAGLTALTSASPQYASKQAMRTEIDRQRRLELAFEGERWFDLLRYTRHEAADASADHAITALDIVRQIRGTADEHYLLFPIPLGELNTNPSITQNPGY